MNNRVYLPAILLFVAVSACTKEDMQPASSDKLQKAVLAGNPDEVETEIDKIFTSPQVQPINNSQEGLNKLAENISTACKLNATVICYNCIKTLPEQSEIKISIDFQGLKKDKIIDITWSENKFVFAGMHDQ